MCVRAYCTSDSSVYMTVCHLAGLTSEDRHAGQPTDLTTVVPAATPAPETLTEGSPRNKAAAPQHFEMSCAVTPTQQHLLDLE